MGTTLYYFSGTGNSLKVARDIADKLGDAEIVSIPDIVDQDAISSSGCIGLVFPVYAYGLPLIATRFLKKLSLQGNDTYVFAVATCKEKKGGCMQQLAHELKAKGLALSAAFAVRMPGNCIHAYNPEPIEEQETKYRQWEARLQEIVSVVTRKEIRVERTGFLERTIQNAMIYTMASHQFFKWDKRFWSDNNCIGCGVCQRVCPVGNIMVKERKPVWLNRCEQCFACINWCPKASIQCGRKTMGRQRYHNPAVKLEDLLGE